MKRCTCCAAPLAIAQSHNPRTVHYEGIIYGLMFECPACMSTQFHTLWREPEEAELEEEERAA